MPRIVAVILVMTMLAAPRAATAQDRDLLASAVGLADAAEPTPDAGGGNRSTGRMATGLALVGTGLVMVLSGQPRLRLFPVRTGKHAAARRPRHVPGRGQLSRPQLPNSCIDAVPRSAPATGVRTTSRAAASKRSNWWNQYGFGFADGHDIGRHEGLVAGYAEGFAAGQAELIRILDAGGLVVYEGRFVPTSSVRETFGDRKAMRYGGAGLLAAGALARPALAAGGKPGSDPASRRRQGRRPRWASSSWLVIDPWYPEHCSTRTRSRAP